MKQGEVKKMVEAIKGKLESDCEYVYFGIRFEDKDREIGEICEASKHNPDREDYREFPEFGTSEYDDLEELDGTSCWDLEGDWLASFWSYNKTPEEKLAIMADHCYVIAGDDSPQFEDRDPNEILITDAVVIAKIF